VGTPETVERFDHTRTKAYHQQAFSPSNMVITAAGNVHHSQIEDLTARYFDMGSPGQGPELRTTAPNPAAPIIIRQNKNLEQAHLLIATPFVSATDESRYAADLLANVIGGSNSSRLWQKIREERGLAYNVGASTIMFRDCGYFSIFAATSPEQTGDVVDIAIQELREVVKDGITTNELDLAKQQARASILLSMEDSASRAGALANLEMTFGRQISVEETLEKIEAVTTEEAHALAQEYFQSEKVAFAALGDLAKLKVDRSRLDV
ncbi:MAG: M16 family metallopeptidase, partial [Pyrinomonadaceae bacterium]